MTTLYWRRLRDWLPELLLLGVTTFAGIWARGRWFDPVGDVGSWWSLIYRLVNGEVLYRDVHLQFGPLSPYLLSFGAAIFGTSSTYLVWASWIAALAAGILLVRLSRNFLNTFERLALAGVVLAVSLFAPGPGRLVLPYAPAAVHALAFSIGALLLLDLRTMDRKCSPWLAGALAGLAFCSKQEIGVAAIVSLGASLLRFSRSGATWLLRCVAGFSIVVGSCAAFVFFSVPIESLRPNHLWPLTFRPPPSWNELYRIVAGIKPVDWVSNYLGTLGVFLFYLSLLALLGVVLARDWRRRGWLPPLALLAVLFGLGGVTTSLNQWFHPIQLSMTIAFAVAVLSMVTAKPDDRIPLVAIGVFAGLVATRTAFSMDLGGHYSGVGHFATSLTWVIFLCLFAPRLMPGLERAGVWTRRAAAVLVFTIGWYSAFNSILSLAPSSKVSFETHKGRIWVEPRTHRVFEGIRRIAEKGQRVWVLPEANGVDALFELRSASPYAWHLPGWMSEEDERRLVAALDRDPPDLVVVFDRPFPEFRLGTFGVGYGLILASWIERNCVAVDVSPGGKVFQRRRAAAIASR